MFSRLGPNHRAVESSGPAPFLSFPNWRSLPPPLLRPPRHPRYWSHSEISGGSRRAFRGEYAAASRPIRCIQRAKVTARRAQRKVDLPLHLA
jgi:hypothetical protein